nr:hypothetical protein [Tanacetum cinerariifolium]
MRMEQYLTFTDHAFWEEDANLKLLRSLPSAWNKIALIMRNKSDLDSLSMDDLYNNLKVYESEIESQSSSSSNSQNVAFVSSHNTRSTNETVNTAHSVSAASSKDKASIASYADDVMFSFFSNKSNAPQRDHFARECKAPRNQGNKSIYAPTRNAPVDTSTTNALVIQDGIGGYDWSFQVKEELTNFALMAYTSQDKTGLGYDGQINKSDLNDIHVNESEVLNNMVDSHESDGKDNQVNDRFKKDSFIFKSKVSETITSVPKIETNTSKTSKDSLEKPKAVRAAVSVSVARHVNTAATRPNVNNALPTTYSYFKAHSPVNNVTTSGPKAVVSAAEGNRYNVVKSLACWIWRPKGNLIDHISKDSGSYTLKRFNYVNLQGRLKHMTENKSYLTDYQEIEGGFVAFRRNAKGGKITGKGKIRTEKLDFEDVYFMKELKFNLFNVS